MAADFLNDYIFLTIGRVGNTSKDITQSVEFVEDEHKLELVKKFLSTIEKKESKDIPLAAVSFNKNTMEFALLINPDEWFKFSDEVKLGVVFGSHVQ